MDESIKKSAYPSINLEFDELNTMDDGAFDAVEETLCNPCVYVPDRFS